MEKKYINTIQPTWSRVLTTHRGFVAIAVAAPAPEAATIFAPNVSWPLLSTTLPRYQKFKKIRTNNCIKQQSSALADNRKEDKEQLVPFEVNRKQKNLIIP